MKDSKSCNKCKEVKPIEEFYKRRKTGEYRQSTCRDCCGKRNKNWAETNPEKLKERSAKWRGARAEVGLCSGCSSPKLANSSMCEEHWFKDVARRRLGDQLLWEYLKRLLEGQGYKCSYTDEILIPGLNASLDHIISKFDDPKLYNEPKNVQWVTKDLNFIKNKLSHESFLSLCRQIAEKFPQK